MIEAALLAIVAILGRYLLAPTFRRTALPPSDPHAALEAARHARQRALGDLDLDWETGKLSDDDYRRQRAVLEAEAASIDRRFENGEAAR